MKPWAAAYNPSSSCPVSNILLDAFCNDLQRASRQWSLHFQGFLGRRHQPALALLVAALDHGHCLLVDGLDLSIGKGGEKREEEVVADDRRPLRASGAGPGPPKA